MLTTTLTAIVTGCNLFQAPPAEPRVLGLNPAVGIASQAVTGVTPGMPSVTVNFDTAMNQADTERAIAMYPGDYNPNGNPTTFNTLTLTSMCNGRWRVRNPNAAPISFNWDVYNTAQKGVGVAPANSDVFFQTSLGSNTVRVFASGRQQQVKATNPAACSSNLFSFAWSGDSRSVTVTPATALTQNSRYTMAVSTNAKSTAGLALAQPYAAAFNAQQPSNISTGTLAPGGSFTSSQGVVITAPANTIAETANVFVQKIEQSEIQVPLPEDVSPVAFYRVGANPIVGVRQGSIYIGFPLGSDVSAQELQDYTILALISTNETSAPINPPYLYWESFFDSINFTQKMIFSRDAELSDTIYAVVKRKSANRQSANRLIRPQQAQPNEPNFIPDCSLLPSNIQCPNQSTRDSISNTLRNEYNLLIQQMQLGNTLPRYKNSYFRAEGTGLCGRGTLAYHLERPEEIYICLNAMGVVQEAIPIAKTLRHEMFHAVQYTLIRGAGVTPGNVQGGFRTGREWIIEGTAEAAVESTVNLMNIQPITRSAYKVTSSLINNTGLSSYNMQDFWVFVGRERGLGIAYLRNILATGLLNNDRDVDRSLRSIGYTNGLEQAYWSWAKNQAFEKNEILRTNDTPCNLDGIAVSAPGSSSLPVTNFNFDSGRYTDTPSIPALTSKVYNFQFTNTKNRTLFVKFTGSANFKLYRIPDDPNCPDGADGTPGIQISLRNQQDSNTLIVIVSNTGSGSGTLELEVLNSPRMVVEPSSNPIDLRTRINTTATTSFPVKNVGTAPMKVRVAAGLPADVSVSVPSTLDPGTSGMVNVSYPCGPSWGQGGVWVGLEALTLTDEPAGTDWILIRVTCTDIAQKKVLLGWQNFDFGSQKGVDVYSSVMATKIADDVSQDALTGDQISTMISMYPPPTGTALVSTYRTQQVDGCDTSPGVGLNYFNFEALCGVLEYEVPSQ